MKKRATIVLSICFLCVMIFNTPINAQYQQPGIIPNYVVYCTESSDGLHHMQADGYHILWNEDKEVLDTGIGCYCEDCGDYLYTDGNPYQGQIIGHYVTEAHIIGHATQNGVGVVWSDYDTLSQIPYRNSTYYKIY